MKKINKNLFYVLVIIVLETLFLKTFMYSILPSKYFFDAKHIIDGIHGLTDMDKTYTYAAKLFSALNFLSFTNIKQWGYLISSIFLPIILFIITKEKKYRFSELIFIISSITLLNIYVLGISKDIIQFTYFLFIYIVLSNKKISNFKKIILINIILLYEALNFRVYYAIMAIIFDTIYFLYYYLKNKNIKSTRKAFSLIFFSLFFFFIEVFIVQFLNSSNYDAILNARYSVNIWRIYDSAAQTIINDPLGFNRNYFVFVGNYIINMFRMLFPLEIFFNGFLQIIFIIYQIYITYNIFCACKKIDNNNILYIITIISFLMISIIFEPDFGSFIRHESTLFIIMLEVIKINRVGDFNVEEKN